MDHIYEKTIERIKAVTRTRTQNELAEILAIRQSSIADAKRRQSVPGAWYMTLFEKLGVNPDWLKSGIGPVYLRTEAEVHSRRRGRNSLAPGFAGFAFVAACACHHVRHAGATARETGQPWPRSADEAASSCQGIRERASSFWRWTTTRPRPPSAPRAHVGIDTRAGCPRAAANCSPSPFPTGEIVPADCSGRRIIFAYVPRIRVS